MITQEDRNILKDVGRKYLLDIAFDSQLLKNKLTFKEHVDLCKFISELSYEDIIGLTITEDIKEFEGKFRKFLKYGFAAVAGLAAGVAGATGIAATAGAILTGPPLGMFVLYIVRKITDTCSRSCWKKFPMSTERKICRYECQVNAIRKVVNDLRSEMSKCSQFRNPNKCEKKLTKEYIKWAKRLQQQMVKLNQAKLGREEKVRKEKQKELAKKARTIAASYQLPKSKLLKVVTENKQFRQNIPFRQHIKIYQAVSSIREDDEEMAVKPPTIDPKKEKFARNALYLGLWVVPIPFFNDVVNYIIKKHSFTCMTKCVKQRKFSRKLCTQQCSYLSAKYAVKMLQGQLTKCVKADKPVKCKKKIYKLLEDWKQREVERKIRFETTLRGELSRAKKREGKI
jgi:hypothetical protein